MVQNRGAARDRPVLVWFRYDLRLADNPALVAAVETGQPVLPVYLLDEASPGVRPLGGASKWWLAESLASLADDLASRGAVLHFARGAAADVLPDLAQASGAGQVVWCRRYDPAERAIDDEVEARLRAQDIEVRTFNGTLWHEPDDIVQKSGDWYRIYTPYWRAASASAPVPEPLPAPDRIEGAGLGAAAALTSLDDLGLRPTKPDWSVGMARSWTPGEPEAQAKVQRFVADALDRYAVDRNVPAIEGSSQLSPHLRFGEVSPQQIIRAAEAAAAVRKTASKAEKYIQEIVWRDFAYNLLAHVPHLADRAYSPRFAEFGYASANGPQLGAWQRGRTGYPIVDAGMRQLWQTGWMHNRVRMITASFLCKHLLLDWRVGEAWFWDTLCDADPASNAVNWQWVAGTGPDAAPFFRIFNPVTQGEKFDPDGHYVRRFVPELERLPPRFIHRPWEAPAAALSDAGVVLGRTYPEPIVDHATARQAALAAFAASRPPEPD